MQVTTGQRSSREHLLFRISCGVGAAMILATFALIWVYRGMELRDLHVNHAELHQRVALLLVGAPGSPGPLAKAATEADASYEMSRALFGLSEGSALLFCPEGLATPFAWGGSPVPGAQPSPQDALAARLSQGQLSSWPMESTTHGTCRLDLRTGMDEEIEKISTRSHQIALSSAVLEGTLLLFLFWMARRGDAGLVQSEKEQQAMESELFFLAHYDTLTHLPNRSLFWERLDAALVRAARLGKAVCLVLVDLRDFTSLNEEQGRAVGDRVLVEAARRIQAAARSSDLVCRLGSDEFAILLEDLDPERSVDAATRLSNALSRQFAESWSETSTSKIRSNCGGALFPHDGASSEELLASAQQAAQIAKNNDTHLVFHGRSIPGPPPLPTISPPERPPQ